MLRQLARQFQRALVLNIPPKTTTENTRFVVLTSTHRSFQRTLFRVEKQPQDDQDFVAVDNATANAPEDAAISHAELDTEYIVPYRGERERRLSAKALLDALRTRFRLSSADEVRILNDDVVMRTWKQRSMLQTLEILCLAGVNKRSFIDQPWLILQEKKRMEQKIALIQTLSVRDFNHFVPLLRLTVPRLRKITAALKRESDVVPLANRIYYISHKLQMDAYVVSQYLSKRLFILEMPFDMLERNLNHMLEYNISPLNILKDLWAFRYTPNSVELRLERAKRAKKDKIMPWMVRCPESILQRSLKISLDGLAVLDGKSSTVEYLAERLQFTVEEARAIMNKHPQVNRVRVTKVKEVLDYLLDEAGFTRYEIANVPRILCHSLETTKERLEELSKHGCRPTSLVIVCRSKREYEKFVKSWIAMKIGKYNTANASESSKQKATVAET